MSGSVELGWESLEFLRLRGSVEHPEGCLGEEFNANGLVEECVGVALL